MGDCTAFLQSWPPFDGDGQPNRRPVRPFDVLHNLGKLGLWVLYIFAIAFLCNL